MTLELISLGISCFALGVNIGMAMQLWSMQ